MKTRILFAVLLACAGGSLTSVAQSPETVRRAFINLRSDEIPHNCGEAVSWLYKHREQVRDDLVAELSRTDPQGRSAIMFVLFNTKSYTPDQRFLRLVMSALPLQSAWLQHRTFDFPDPAPGEELSMIRDRWGYVDAQFEKFEPMLSELIGKTNDVWMVWGAAWMFKKHGVLARKAELFTPEVLQMAASRLVNDRVSYNASQAVRLFLLLGKQQSLPALKGALKSPDAQARSFAKATIDALDGNRRAFGFLNSRVDLTHTLAGQRPPEPEWLHEATEAFMDDSLSYP